MDGILAINKPVGITSFDVIREFKHAILPDFKIGHGGTLDPFADGVLLLLLGKATKKMDQLSALPKTYRAVAILGASSDTLDNTGVITASYNNAEKSLDEIKKVATQYVGEIDQAIPDYSATKINGVPRYKLARQGIAMVSKNKKVNIHSIENIQFVESNGSNHRTMIEMTVTCSAGTYIRQLTYDIFTSMGIESYLDQLTRTEIGEYKLQNCCQIEDLRSSKWQDMVVPLEQLSHDE